MLLTVSIVAGVLFIASLFLLGLYLKEKNQTALMRTSLPGGSKFFGEEEAELREVYEDKDGRKWLEFANPLKIPSRRAIQVEIALRQSEMNITLKNLSLYLNEMEAKANAGEVTQLFYLLQRLKERLTWCGEAETLERVARLFFLLPDEPPERVTERFAKQKEEIFEKDPDLRDFFVVRAFKLTKGFSDISETDILTYLAERAVREGLQPDPTTFTEASLKSSGDTSTTSTTKPRTSPGASRVRLTGSSTKTSKAITRSSRKKSGK